MYLHRLATTPHTVREPCSAKSYADQITLWAVCNISRITCANYLPG